MVLDRRLSKVNLLEHHDIISNLFGVLLAADLTVKRFAIAHSTLVHNVILRLRLSLVLHLTQIELDVADVHQLQLLLVQLGLRHKTFTIVLEVPS